MKIMALDVGRKRIGVAISDELEITAQPHGTVNRAIYKDDLAKLIEIATKTNVKIVVLGMPFRTDNSKPGEMAGEIKRFAKDIKESGFETEFLDERFTTTIAENALISQGMRREKRKTVIDTVAAQVILQDFLEIRRSKRTY